MPEIKQLIERYDQISKGFSQIEQEVSLLQSRKTELEEELQLTRDREMALIDKIKKETGELPDYFKMMQALNEKGSAEFQEI